MNLTMKGILSLTEIEEYLRWKNMKYCYFSYKPFDRFVIY